MAERCVLCLQLETKDNPVNRHHYRGKKNYPHDVMRVHSRTCHVFAQWVTNLYISKKMEDQLTINSIVYLFNRICQIRNDGVVVLPL